MCSCTCQCTGCHVACTQCDVACVVVLCRCRVTADPKLTVLLSLVPSSLEASILQQYSLAPAANATAAAAAQTIARRALLADTFMAPEHLHLRSLLQANSSNSTNATAPTASNSTFASPAPKPSPSPSPAGQTNSSSTAPVGWTYLSDYEMEPPSIDMFDAPAPLPANYTFEQLASPDGGNAVQDWLPLNASIITYQGQLGLCSMLASNLDVCRAFVAVRGVCRPAVRRCRSCHHHVTHAAGRVWP